MKQRVITAIFFGAAMIGGIYGNRYTFFGLFLLITAGAAWELMGLLLPVEAAGRRLRQVAGCLMALLPVVFAGGHWVLGLEGASVLVWIGLGLFLLMLFELFDTAPAPFQYLGYYALAALYIGLPFALLCHIALPEGQYLPNRVMGLLGLVWINDTFAYFIGSQLGRHKLLERVSPKKTWEGTIGGGLLSVAAAWGLSRVLPDYTAAEWVALGIVTAVFATLGDLVESLLKRSVGVKDSGDLLPGHGGFLDRFDAFIYMLPFVWAVLTWVKG